MSDSKKKLPSWITTTISCVVAIAAALGYMLMPSNDGKAFHDVVGYWLIGGIFACPLLITLYIGVSYFLDRSINQAEFRMLCFLGGLMFLCIGIWAYGEKARFAKLAVIEVEGTITTTNMDCGSRSYRCDFKASYQYTDHSGNSHAGHDSINAGKTWAQLYVGGPVRIHYLEETPAVSRIIEASNTQAYIVKSIFILFGLWLAFCAPQKFLRYEKTIEQRIITRAWKQSLMQEPKRDDDPTP
jgi:hypothetical protein